jgi:hypothetical protein
MGAPGFSMEPASRTVYHQRHRSGAGRLRHKRSPNMAISGYIDYKRREFCKDVKCPIQRLLDRAAEGTADHEEIRRICMTDCIHTTYEFHHWLIERGYEVMRKTGA